MRHKTLYKLWEGINPNMRSIRVPIQTNPSKFVCTNSFKKKWMTCGSLSPLTNSAMGMGSRPPLGEWPEEVTGEWPKEVAARGGE